MNISKVLKIERVPAEQVHDITVLDNSNFYAGHGNPALVHNCRHVIIRDIIGKPVHTVNIPKMVPKIIIHPLPYVKSKAAYAGPAGWTRCNQFLSRHEKRNEEILEWVQKDLEKGHSIVIPVYFREQVLSLVEAINQNYGKKIAQPFLGGTKEAKMREVTLDNARAGKTRVVVGIRSLLQLGLNVPLWSAIYYIAPISNAPNWEQESSRVLTPAEPGQDKRNPIIRMFVDENIGLALGCWANTYKQSLSFGHIPTDAARERASVLLSKLKNKDNDDPGFDVEPDSSFFGVKRKKRK